MMGTFPYLVNINEDPQLSGVLKYFIQDGIVLFKMCVFMFKWTIQFVVLFFSVIHGVFRVMEANMVLFQGTYVVL